MGKFAGWSNRLTWRVNMWFINDYELYMATMSLARAAVLGGHGKAWLADKLYDHVWDMVGLDSIKGPQWELMSTAVDMVDWHEIADSFLQDVREAHEPPAEPERDEDYWTDESDLRVEVKE